MLPGRECSGDSSLQGSRRRALATDRPREPRGSQESTAPEPVSGLLVPPPPGGKRRCGPLSSSLLPGELPSHRAAHTDPRALRLPPAKPHGGWFVPRLKSGVKTLAEALSRRLLVSPPCACACPRVPLSQGRRLHFHLRTSIQTPSPSKGTSGMVSFLSQTFRQRLAE